MRLFTNYEQKVVERMKERFSPEDAAKLDEMLRVISNELMPECEEDRVVSVLEAGRASVFPFWEGPLAGGGGFFFKKKIRHQDTSP